MGIGSTFSTSPLAPPPAAGLNVSRGGFTDPGAFWFWSSCWPSDHFNLTNSKLRLEGVWPLVSHKSTIYIDLSCMCVSETLIMLTILGLWWHVPTRSKDTSTQPACSHKSHTACARPWINQSDILFEAGPLPSIYTKVVLDRGPGLPAGLKKGQKWIGFGKCIWFIMIQLINVSTKSYKSHIVLNTIYIYIIVNSITYNIYIRIYGSCPSTSWTHLHVRGRATRCGASSASSARGPRALGVGLKKWCWPNESRRKRVDEGKRKASLVSWHRIM